MSFNKDGNEPMTHEQYNNLMRSVTSMKLQLSELTKTTNSLLIWASGDETVKTHGVEQKLQQSNEKINELKDEITYLHSKTNKITYVAMGVYIVTMIAASLIGIDVGTSSVPYPVPPYTP